MASFLKLLDQDNLSLDEYAWYAGDMNVDDAKEHLDKLPVGKWQSLSILDIKPSEILWGISGQTISSILAL